MSSWRDHIQVIVVPLGQSAEELDAQQKAAEAVVDEMIEKMGDEAA